MATMSVATKQMVWDCYWSRPGYRVTGVPDELQPETVWVCIRTGYRRNIHSKECEDCRHWANEPGGQSFR
jgi:hypothetical protein